VLRRRLALEIGSRGIHGQHLQPLVPSTRNGIPPRATGGATKAATAHLTLRAVDEIATMVAFVAGPESSYHYRGNLPGGGMNA